jgi:glycerophosphoryl diester phosphodiesterase
MIDVPRIVAHRGSSGRAPENTLHAMHVAIDEDGAGGLELDLQRSADGEVVVLHDETVDRTTDGTGRADRLPLAALLELDAGARFGDGSFTGRGIRIPTLEQVLEAFPKTWLSLDLKQGDPLTEQATVALLRRFGRTGDVVLSAEDAAAARRVARIAPEIPRFVHRAGVRSFYLRHRLRFFPGWQAPGQSLQIPVRHGRLDLSSGRLIRDAHARGMRVLYWTINDVDLASELFRRGADGIITDFPARMRELATA